MEQIILSLGARGISQPHQNEMIGKSFSILAKPWTNLLQTKEWDAKKSVGPCYAHLGTYQSSAAVF